MQARIITVLGEHMVFWSVLTFFEVLLESGVLHGPFEQLR